MMFGMSDSSRTRVVPHAHATEPLGLESGVVRLVEYDARWPALFLAERLRLIAASDGLPPRSNSRP